MKALTRRLRVGETATDARGAVYIGWLDGSLRRLDLLELPKLTEAIQEAASIAQRLEEFQKSVQTMIVARRKLTPELGKQS